MGLIDALHFIGKLTSKRDLQDFPIGNQPRKIVKMKIQDMPEYETISNAVYRLEGIEKRWNAWKCKENVKKHGYVEYDEIVDIIDSIVLGRTMTLDEKMSGVKNIK